MFLTRKCFIESYLTNHLQKSTECNLDKSLKALAHEYLVRGERQKVLCSLFFSHEKESTLVCTTILIYRHHLKHLPLHLFKK